jgi:ABC-2 type transport system permease protein
LIGVLFLGVDITKINIISSLVVLVLTVICFGGVGIIAGAIIMLFKKSAPFAWFISAFSAFFGGVYFPVEMLPSPLRFVSYLLPITYSLRSFRYTILQGYSLLEIRDDILVLIIYAAVLIPVSILLFKMSLREAKKNGTLAYY